jgi:DNA-binding response OmpR family regulator
MNIWVLVVDDDEAMRRGIARLLSEAGYSTMAVASAEALRLCQETEPELVIADVAPPLSDGVDTMMELRRSGVVAKILAMSGLRPQGGVDVAETLLRLGADDVLLKPFEPEVLLAKVDRLVSLPFALTAA